MTFLWILCGILAFLLLITYIFYLIAFRGRLYSLDISKGDRLSKPPYTEFESAIRAGIEFIKTREHETVTIRSYDGLRLVGRYYDVPNPRALVIFFHGYRASADTNFSCAVEYFLNRGFSVLLIDERAHGKSGGRTITFGVKERRDVVSWAEYAAERWQGRKIIIDGISMGAATVLMASELKLPENVRAVVADCGYTSPKEIIKKVVRDFGAPADILYPFVRIGAILWGGFDPEASDAAEAVRHSDLPLFIAHGEADGFVPCEMSHSIFEAARAENKRLVTVPGADHGLSFLVDRDKVTDAMNEFFDEVL